MKIEFTGRNFTVSPAIKKHTQEHFNKLESILSRATSAHAILSIEKHRRHVAEIIVHLRDRELTSTASSDDMYQSVAQAINKLHRQAQKLKEKRIDQKHHVVPAKLSVARSANEPVEPAEREAPRIIRTRRYSIKPLTPEEAMQDVSTAPEQFLVFRNAESEKISVIYKRKDGNFGLIEP